MSIDDVLVGESTIRVLTMAGEEFEFDRSDDEVAYQGDGEPPQAAIDALEERGFTVAAEEWPTYVDVYVSDEPSGRNAAADLFPDKGTAYDIASGMGTHLDLTYRVEQNGENTLVAVDAPDGGRLVRQQEETPDSVFNEVWVEYTREQFDKEVELYIPESLSPAEYEEVGYMPASRRSDNEPFNWSAFYDFYMWLVENGYAIVPIDE